MDLLLLVTAFGRFQGPGAPRKFCPILLGDTALLELVDFAGFDLLKPNSSHLVFIALVWHKVMEHGKNGSTMIKVEYSSHEAAKLLLPLIANGCTDCVSLFQKISALLHESPNKLHLFHWANH